MVAKQSSLGTNMNVKTPAQFKTHVYQLRKTYRQAHGIGARYLYVGIDDFELIRSLPYDIEVQHDPSPDGVQTTIQGLKVICDAFTTEPTVSCNKKQAGQLTVISASLGRLNTQMAEAQVVFDINGKVRYVVSKTITKHTNHNEFSAHLDAQLDHITRRYNVYFNATDKPKLNALLIAVRQYITSQKQ